MAVYLMGIYMDEEARQEFEAAYKATGKRLDTGKSCVRFGKLEDVSLELIGEGITITGVTEFVERVKKAHPQRKSKAT
jgi:hypothetical protein